MFKMFSKLLLTLLISILVITSISFCYATEAVTTAETESTENVETTAEETTEPVEPEIPEYYGDLYLLDSNVSLENIIYGNVYILADNVQINSQIEGNLFVLANNVSLLDKAFINGSAYICSKNIYYNSAARYLYAITNDLEMTFDSYVIRDAKIKADTANISAAIGRNFDLISNNFTLGDGEKKAIIYGDFSYSAPSEITISEGILAENGDVKYTKIMNNNINILLNFVTCIITTITISLIIIKFIPSFNNKLGKPQNIFIKLLKCFVLGLITLIAVTLASILLLIINVGSTLSFILLSVFTLLSFIAVPIFSIGITNMFKFAKGFIYYIILALLSIILYGFTLIPFASIGLILNIIIKIISIGFVMHVILLQRNLKNKNIE